MGKRKQKDTPIEMDTDPIGVPKRKRKSKKGGGELANLILEGRSEDVRIVTVHTDPPKKKRRWLRWGIIGFAVLWVMSLFAPPREDAQPPQVNQVASVPSNTPRPSLTPVIRETVTAEALASMVAMQTQNAPTQTPIVEYVVITATPSETDIPTETNIPTDAPLPSATPMTSNVAVAMVTNTPIPSPTNTETATATVTHTPLPISTATPPIRVLERNGIVTYDFVNVRACASSTCDKLGELLKNATFEVTDSIDGENVSGSVLWYQIDYRGQVGYVHSSLVAVYTGQPPVNNVSVPVQPVSPVQPVAPISLAPAGGWDCSYDKYNCADFSDREQMLDYFNTCLQQTGRDVSRLDQGGVEGEPCED